MWIFGVRPIRERIIKSIHEGIRIAKEKHEKQTNAPWEVRPGLESVLVGEICETLCRHQHGSGSVRREITISDILERSKADKHRGPLFGALKNSKRKSADIVLFNGQKQPTCVIEVKRDCTNYARCDEDIDRIYRLVQTCSSVRNGSLERGFFAVLLFDTNLDQKMDQIIRQVYETHEKKSNLKIKHEKRYINQVRVQDNTWQSASLSIEISP